MIDVVELEGGVPVECDTDGIFFSHPEPVKVFEVLQAALPVGINIELEVQARAIFVPERGAKNYVLWHEDGQITAKGSWRSRDRSLLEKEFPLQYLTHYLESSASAEEYYQQLAGALASRQLSIRLLQE
jgi:DNA polymerase elongation subunit (family B)